MNFNRAQRSNHKSPQKKSENKKERKVSSFQLVPFSRAQYADLSEAQTIYLDIDDTLSTQGKLTAEAYEALWKLKLAGFSVVPVTGRPAGWCDHIARFWPVDAVIGENGAFIFRVESKGSSKNRKFIRHYTEATPLENKARLKKLYQKIQKKFGAVKVASDQAYREFDLAIDWCEDVKPWSKEKVNELLKFCKKNQAHAKLSSIHVNIWFGEYDKITGIQHFAQKFQAEKKRKNKLELKTFKKDLFIGDSPNDAPAFRVFQNSVGVANLKNVLGDLTDFPRWITQAESGAGFAEMVRHLLKVTGTRQK